MGKYDKNERLQMNKFEVEEGRLNFFTTKNWKKLFCKKDDDMIETDEDEAPHHLSIIINHLYLKTVTHSETMLTQCISWFDQQNNTHLLFI